MTGARQRARPHPGPRIRGRCLLPRQTPVVPEHGQQEAASGTEQRTRATFLSWEASSDSLASSAAECPEDKGSDCKADRGQERGQGRKETEILHADHKGQERLCWSCRSVGARYHLPDPTSAMRVSIPCLRLPSGALTAREPVRQKHGQVPRVRLPRPRTRKAGPSAGSCALSARVDHSIPAPTTSRLETASSTAGFPPWVVRAVRAGRAGTVSGTGLVCIC